MTAREAKPDRLNGFSDAAFAVIITILVLDLKPPQYPSLDALISLWPTAVSYAVSYLFIAIVWVNHHHLVRYAGIATPRLVWGNFAHLFAVSLMPFSTAWIAGTNLAGVPVSLYAGVFVLVNATYVLLYWEVIDRPNIEEVPPGARKIMRVRSLVTLGLFAAAALVALRYPVGGMALICLCLVVYVQPEAPGVKTHRSEVAGSDNRRQNPSRCRVAQENRNEVTKKRRRTMPKFAYRRVTVSGLEIFYREAGPSNAPTILLLHGFPTASHMFRDLMPRLADRFRMIAPDLPGFGQSAMPTDGRFQYTFECLALTMGRFTEALNLDRFATYIFDYGAPVGLRMALEHHERITAIISQNGNAYEEGLSPNWDSMKAYWRHPTDEYRESLYAAFTPEATRYQYVQGVGDPSMVSPDGSTLDEFYLARPGAHEVQISLFTDYASNVALYPKFQEYFRSHKPPLLAVWGRNDPYFLPAGAEAFRRDLPDADVRLIDTGHFALETHCEEIANAISDFLDARVAR